MAAAHVQSKSLNAGSGSSGTIAVTFTSNVTAGNLICGMASWGSGTGSVSSVTDSLGNTYTVVDTVHNATDGVSAATFYAKNITGGACTVTVTFDTTYDFRTVAVHEASGLDTTAPLDVHTGQAQTTPGTGANAVTSGAVTTTAAGDYIFGATTNTGGSDDTPVTAGTGYTIRENTAFSNFVQTATESQVQGSAGSIAATFTHAVAVSRISFILTFKAAGGGTVYNDSLALSVTGSFTLANTVDWLGSLGLAGTGGFAGAGGSDFTDNVSLAVTAAMAEVADLLFDLSLALGLTGGYAVAVSLDAVGDLALGLTGALALANTVDFLASLGLAGTGGFDGQGGSDFSDSLSLSVTPDFVVVGDLVVPLTGDARFLVRVGGRGLIPAVNPRIYVPLVGPTRVQTLGVRPRRYIFFTHPKPPLGGLKA